MEVQTPLQGKCEPLMRISEPPRWIMQSDLLRPGSDAVLHMSRIEF